MGPSPLPSTLTSPQLGSGRTSAHPWSTTSWTFRWRYTPRWKDSRARPRWAVRMKATTFCWSNPTPEVFASSTSPRSLEACRGQVTSAHLCLSTSKGSSAAVPPPAACPAAAWNCEWRKRGCRRVAYRVGCCHAACSMCLTPAMWRRVWGVGRRVGSDCCVWEWRVRRTVGWLHQAMVPQPPQVSNKLVSVLYISCLSDFSTAWVCFFFYCNGCNKMCNFNDILTTFSPFPYSFDVCRSLPMQGPASCSSYAHVPVACLSNVCGPVSVMSRDCSMYHWCLWTCFSFGDAGDLFYVPVMQAHLFYVSVVQVDLFHILWCAWTCCIYHWY